MAMWRDRAFSPSTSEYIICCDEDDPTRFDTLRRTTDIDGFKHNIYVEHPKTGSAAAWDWAAKFSTGTVLIQGQDDIEPPEGWDKLLFDKIFQSLGGCQGMFETPIFVAVSDGFRKDALCCTAIMNRARYKACGEFLHAGYQSVFSDDEVTYRALRDASDGKCIYINARDLVFTHRHHYHDPSVPMDETYRRENSSEAYGKGALLFAQRNPKAATDGIRSWA